MTRYVFILFLCFMLSSKYNGPPPIDCQCMCGGDPKKCEIIANEKCNHHCGDCENCGGCR